MKKSHPHLLIAIMNSRLQQKYQSILSFYEAKSINQILAGNPHCTTYMDFCDLKILLDDTQYLKRMYYYRTPTGKPEIQQRMKVISQLYSTNPSLSTFTYQYPMMILTNTKSLFLRRKRRLRKIQAGQGSSDFTEQRDQQYLQYEVKSENFLQDLSKSMISEQEEEQQALSFQSNEYDIFSQASLQSQKCQINLHFSQDNLKHLIQDFTSFSPVEHLYSNFDGQLPSFSLGKQALNNIENWPKNSKESIFSIVPLEEKPKIQKKEKKSSLIGDMITQILQRPINFSNIGLNLQKFAPPYQYKNIGVSSQQQSLDKQKEERATRRQQIRQKAEELLRKVRNIAKSEQ